MAASYTVVFAPEAATEVTEIEYDIDHDETEIQVVRVRHGKRRALKRR